MKQFIPYFSQNPLDRCDLLRGNKKEIIKLQEDKNSLFLLFYQSSIIVDENKGKYFFTLDELAYIKNNFNDEVVFLGKNEEVSYFAITLEEEINNFSIIDLRTFASLTFVEEERLGIVAQAAAVLNWHSSHKFCSFCGEKSVMSRAGWKRDCPVCKKEHFPRTDVAVIMLVTYGEYCLIGHGVNFKEKRYSCLAGYMESGETLEDAAKRELFEEAGVEGYNAQYMFSQPWPFPSTLMVGMRLKAKSKELTLDKNEISDAMWVHKNDIKAVLNGSEDYDFLLPNKIAIARNILEVWVEEE